MIAELTITARDEDIKSRLNKYKDLDFVSRHTVGSLPRKISGDAVHAVYLIRNTVSGKSYIGSSDDVARRFQAHLSHLRRGIHYALLLQNSWSFHGESAFEFIIVETFPSRDGLIEREQELIDHFCPEFNSAACAANPMLGRKHKPESIEKMRAARTGKGLGPRTFSAQHRAALSAALKGKPRPELRGKKHSDSTKKRMSSLAKEKFARGFLSPTTRPVQIYGVTYRSGADAARALGISRSLLTKRIKGGYGRYLDEPDNGCGFRVKPEYKPPTGADNKNARAVIVDGVLFATQTLAAKHFGKSRPTLTYWLERGKARYADGSPPPQPRKRPVRKTAPANAQAAALNI